MAYKVMAYIVTAYIVMGYIVMAYIPKGCACMRTHEGTVTALLCGTAWLRCTALHSTTRHSTARSSTPRHAKTGAHIGMHPRTHIRMWRQSRYWHTCHACTHFHSRVHGTARHDTARHGTACHGTAQHGTSWHATAPHALMHATQRNARKHVQKHAHTYCRLAGCSMTEPATRVI